MTIISKSQTGHLSVVEPNILFTLADVGEIVCESIIYMPWLSCCAFQSLFLSLILIVLELTQPAVAVVFGL